MQFNFSKVLLLTLLFSSFSIIAQDENEPITKTDPKVSEQKMPSGNYDEALDDFLECT